MFQKKFLNLAMVTVTALTALALAAPAALASGSGPVIAAEPANDPAYVDNRSDAVNLLVSYFNALDRHEYDRAYSYWESGSAVGSYAAFKAGYANTQSITISTGQVGGYAGAGQRYYIVPVTLQAATTSGPQTFVGCYVEHLALPELQSAPFQGLSIHSATILPVPSGGNADALRAQACTTAGLDGTPAVSITQTPAAPESGAQFYIDSRSGALEVIQSLMNAINRKEYARAYGYWESNSGLPSYATFAAGYANTQAVQWTYGPVSSDAGAGQYYYSVPVTLRAQTTSGLQTFVGCYVLHLANPSIQDNPPYQPIGIHSGSFTQVSNSANTNSLMATACTSTPQQTPPPTSNGVVYVSFAPGATSASQGGNVAANGTQEYRLWVGAGQWLIADLQAAQPNAYLQIIVGATGQIIGQTTPGTVHWQGLTPSTGRYWVRVISNGNATSFNLKLTIPRRVSFARGASSANIYGSLAAGGINSYVLRAGGGQTMTATLYGASASARLEIYRLSDGQSVLSGGANATTWTGTLPSTDDYIVRVVSTGPHTTYTLSTAIH
jgi:hypothetical protein